MRTRSKISIGLIFIISLVLLWIQWNRSPWCDEIRYPMNGVWVSTPGYRSCGLLARATIDQSSNVTKIEILVDDRSTNGKVGQSKYVIATVFGVDSVGLRMDVDSVVVLTPMRISNSGTIEREVEIAFGFVDTPWIIDGDSLFAGSGTSQSDPGVDSNGK